MRSILSLFGVRAPWDIEPGRVIVDEEPGDYSIQVLKVAKGEQGHGEESLNNEGPRITLYRNGGPGGAWCAAFVAHCLEEAARNMAVPCPVKRSHGAKKLFANAVQAGYAVRRPLPGDLVLWHRGARDAATGHIGICSARAQDGMFLAIEGNRGAYPSKVREFAHELGEANLLGFCRIRMV